MDLGIITKGHPNDSPPLNVVFNSVRANHFYGGPGYGPATVGKYSQISTITVANTDFGSITDGATHVGSLTLPPLAVGSVVKISGTGLASATAASINYALYIDGKQATVPTAYGNISAAQVSTSLLGSITVKSLSSVACFLQATMDNNASRSNNQLSFAYDSTVSHDIDIFAFISVTDPDNGFQCNNLVVEISNSG